MELSEEGRYYEAAEKLREATRINPDFMYGHSNEATCRWSMGQYEEAILCARRALALDPNDAKSHYNMAKSLMKLGTITGAAYHAQRAVDLMNQHDSDDRNEHILLDYADTLHEATQMSRYIDNGQGEDPDVDLRFQVGERVECSYQGWQLGTVVYLWYQEEGWDWFAPYLTQFDND